MTRGLLKSSKKKELLYLKFIKNPTLSNKNKFTVYRNKFKAIRVKAERNYYAAEFCKYNGDLKQTWRLIKSLVKTGSQGSTIESLVIEGTRTDNPEAMANKFNDYFVNIAKSLADKIPNSPNSFTTYLKPPLLQSFGLNLTSPEEILNLSHSIHPSHSKGVDDIDPLIASKHLGSIAQPLADIINCSFTYGIFPQALKTAKIVPIFKRGAKDDFKNWLQHVYSCHVVFTRCW